MKERHGYESRLLLWHVILLFLLRAVCCLNNNARMRSDEPFYLLTICTAVWYNSAAAALLQVDSVTTNDASGELNQCQVVEVFVYWRSLCACTLLHIVLGAVTHVLRCRPSPCQSNFHASRRATARERYVKDHRVCSHHACSVHMQQVCSCASAGDTAERCRA